MYQTEINGRKIVVEKLTEVCIRTSAAIKRTGVLYRDTRTGELCVRAAADFELLFKPCRGNDS